MDSKISHLFLKLWYRKGNEYLSLLPTLVSSKILPFSIPDSSEYNRSIKVVLRDLVKNGGRIYEFRKLFGETPSTKGTRRSEKDLVWKTSQVRFSCHMVFVQNFWQALIKQYFLFLTLWRNFSIVVVLLFYLGFSPCRWKEQCSLKALSLKNYKCHQRIVLFCWLFAFST